MNENWSGVDVKKLLWKLTFQLKNLRIDVCNGCVCKVRIINAFALKEIISKFCRSLQDEFE